MKSMTILLSAIAVILVSGCSQSATRGDNAGQQNDSLPQPVKQIIHAITTNDSAEFASVTSYPISRPYPLHDIESEEQMRRYFHTLVDDSLRTVVAQSTADDWHQFGWRGWSLKDGEYLWADESLYLINYLSNRESAMRDSLVNAEMNSLSPALRKNWTPVSCLRAAGEPTLFRIDAQKNPDGSSTYRLCRYSNPLSLTGQPDEILTGYLEIEGSAATQTFYFNSPDGTKAEYAADVADDAVPSIIFTRGSSTDTVPVTKTYWLEELLKH